MHACSVGEVGVARPLVEVLNTRFEGMPIVVTTSTVAGRALASSTVHGADIAWFPFDHRYSVSRFYGRLVPRLLVLIETELWPNVLFEARRRHVPVALINARISDKHYPRYRRFRRSVGKLLECIDAAGVQSEVYAQRLHELGLPPSRIHVTGNIKFDGLTTEIHADTLDRLRNQCGLDPSMPVVVFGSTRPGDEALAAACWNVLRTEFPKLRCIVAPRHLQRLDEAVAPFSSRVLLGELRAGRRAADDAVIVVDTLGELSAVYALATVAVMGGSFFPGVNGHNPLEPAALGKPVVFGPYMSNFAEPARVLVDAGAAVQVSDSSALPDALRGLLRSETRRAEMGKAAEAAIRANRGALSKTADLIADLLLKSDSDK